MLRYVSVIAMYPIPMTFVQKANNEQIMLNVRKRYDLTVNLDDEKPLGPP